MSSSSSSSLLPTQPDAQATAKLQAEKLIRVLVVLFFVAVTIGIIMAWIFFFRSYDGTFASLAAADLTLEQALYNETNARTLKDMAMMQKQAQMQADFDQDVIDRQREQRAINESLAIDIAERIAGDQAILDGILNETVARIANDTELQYEIDNATAVALVIEAFDVFSTQKFMIIMQNISDLEAAIEAERDARIAEDMILMTNDLLIDTALVLLVTQLNTEITERTTFDNWINLQLHLITDSIIHTVNGQSPDVNGDIRVNSLNTNTLTITNGVPADEIIVTNFALGIIAGVTGDPATGNVDFVAVSGLTLDFPAPNTLRISYTDGAPVMANFARLSIVVPHGMETCVIQSQDGGMITGKYCIDHFLNGIYECTDTPACHVLLGSQWQCSGGFSSSSNMNQRCRMGAVTGAPCWNSMTMTADESQCNDLLGEPWHCRGSNCIKDYCTVDYDCQDAFGVAANTQWFCNNYRCARAQSVGDTLPVYWDTYPTADGTNQRISQPSGPPCNENCPNPQQGLMNGQLNTPIIRGNKRPWALAGVQAAQNLECFFPTWEGQTCGFVMPASGGTYLVQVVVTIRIAFGADVRYPRFWFTLWIDWGTGWQIPDVDFSGKANLEDPMAAFSQNYVTMSTTVILSSSFMAPGVRLSAGWSAFWDQSNAQNADCFAKWYKLTFDVTKIAD